MKMHKTICTSAINRACKCTAELFYTEAELKDAFALKLSIAEEQAMFSQDGDHISGMMLGLEL